MTDYSNLLFKRWMAAMKKFYAKQRKKLKTKQTRFYKKLPKGNYSIIGLAKDLDMPQWVDVIGSLLEPIEPDEFLKANNLNRNTTLILQKC